MLTDGGIDRSASAIIAPWLYRVRVLNPSL